VQLRRVHFRGVRVQGERDGEGRGLKYKLTSCQVVDHTPSLVSKAVAELTSSSWGLHASATGVGRSLCIQRTFFKRSARWALRRACMRVPAGVRAG